MQKLKSRVGGCLRGNLLVYLTLASVVGGVIVGAIMKSSRAGKFSSRERMYVYFPAQIFLQILRAIILPLIVSAVVSAVGSLDLKTSWKIVARAMVYYMTTTVTAVTIGCFMSATIRPGYRSVAEVSTNVPRTTTITDTILDLIRNIFPPNIVQACISRYQTILIEPTAEDYAEAAAVGRNLTVQDWKMDGHYVDGTNAIGMVIFAIALGIAVSKMEEGGKPLLELFGSLAAASMVMTRWALWLSPLGVASMIASRVLDIESVSVLAKQLGWYMTTILAGLFVHAFVAIPLIFFVMTRKMPFTYMYNLTEALITAFATSSSNATLPVAMRCVEEKNKVDVRVTKCVMPIGTTINMDGTALYEASAALFIAQLRNVPLSFGQYIIVSLTATLATMGLAGIPQSALVSLIVVLDSIGLPASDASIIIVIDWFLERFRTVVNVISDSMGVGIVDHLSRGELEEDDRHAEALGVAHTRRLQSNAAASVDLQDGGASERLLAGHDVVLKVAQ